MKPEIFVCVLLVAPLAVRPAHAADAMVVMKNFDFSPMDLTIASGDTVVWTNMDGDRTP